MLLANSLRSRPFTFASSLASSLALALLAGGCASPNDGLDADDLPLVVVAAVGDLAAAFEGVERVGLHPDARRAEPGACRSPTIYRRLADDALTEVLVGRGYEVVDEAAEVWLAYAVGMNGRVASPDLARALGVEVGEPALAAERSSGVALVVLDARDDRVLWRGTDDADLRRTSYDADEARARLRARFDVLLADLPVAGE